jgi:porin
MIAIGRKRTFTNELFYRLQLTKEIAVTPDIQYVIDPALNSDENSIWSFGLRSRIAL